MFNYAHMESAVIARQLCNSCYLAKGFMLRIVESKKKLDGVMVAF
jgi:hypothetical protein